MQHFWSGVRSGSIYVPGRVIGIRIVDTTVMYNNKYLKHWTMDGADRTEHQCELLGGSSMAGAHPLEMSRQASLTCQALRHVSSTIGSLSWQACWLLALLSCDLRMTENHEA